MQAYVLRAQMTSWLMPFTQVGLHPSRRPTCPPPRIDRNIDVRHGTNPQAKRTSSACARLIEGQAQERNRRQRRPQTRGRIARWVRSPEFARVVRKAGSRTGIYEDSSQAEFARWCLRRGGQSRNGVARRNSRVDLARRVSRAQKKRRSEERRPSPHNYGRKPDPP